MTSRSQKITFAGSEGIQLAGRLDFPDGEPLAYALWAHCFSCTKDVFAASRIAAGLTDHGIAVLRFDFTGLGTSEGDFANTNFSSNINDLVAAADYLRENYMAPELLVGHSLGGAAVLSAGPRIPEARAICTIGAPADPAHVAHLFKASRTEIEKEGEAEVQLAGRPFRIKKQFLDDIADQKLLQGVARLKKALLIVHSPIDDYVGIDNASQIFQAARHPKSFISLDNADHMVSRKADAIYVANVIAAWASHSIPSISETSNETGSKSRATAAKPGTVVVEETGQGQFANRVSIGGRHTLIADEPADVGGTDTGPTPYDLLLAALGACKTMTMRMYAERKGIDLEQVRATLKHSKIHADDCESCETAKGRIDQIEVEIEVLGDMDEETRSRIAEISRMCPVHRTLQSEVVIKTSHLT